VKRLLSMYSNLSEESEKKRERPRHRRSVSKGLRNPPNKWAKEESQRLIQLVNDYGDKSWKKIAEHVGGGKTGAQCAQHWKRVLCPIIRKGSWDDEEELKLFRLVEKYGQSWKNIASEIGSRTDIQCRYQYFKSCMSREVAWSSQEDDLLMKKMNDIKCENRDIHWVEVARYMARGRLTKIPRTALECRTRHELLTSPPQTDVKSLSSSVNIVRDCPDLPVVLPPDLDIGTVPNQLRRRWRRGRLRLCRRPLQRVAHHEGHRHGARAATDDDRGVVASPSAGGPQAAAFLDWIWMIYFSVSFQSRKGWGGLFILFWLSFHDYSELEIALAGV